MSQISVVDAIQKKNSFLNCNMKYGGKTYKKLIDITMNWKSDINTNKAFSFTNANYLHHKTINQFFNEFEKIIKLNSSSLSYNHMIIISNPNFFKHDIQIKIETKQDFEYAKFLYKMIVRIIL
jgi:hypothetical protein